MEAMYPDLPCPTLDDLTTVFSSPEYVELAKPFGLNNPNNFSADQVGAVLRLWGLHNSLSLRLGYVVKERHSYFHKMGTPMLSGSTMTTAKLRGV